MNLNGQIDQQMEGWKENILIYWIFAMIATM